MKTSINTGNPVPTAHVTVNKNRVKIYDDKNYYLNNGQTFEIELFNPTTNKIKADIHLDGNKVSGGGLILRPGERIYLERFVDSNNKFLFETYDVDDSEEAMEAISNNGQLQVMFYKETSGFNLNDFGGTYAKTFGGPTVYYNTDTTGNINLSGWHTPHDATYNITSNGDGTYSNATTNFLNTTNVSENVGLTSYSNVNDMVLGDNAKSIETGRTEKGEESNQTFKTVSGEYDSIAFEVVEYKISPVSNKPITKEDVTKVKRYCHECGSKTKVKYKFCPVCGEKL
jgi:hypothetical protein